MSPGLSIGQNIAGHSGRLSQQTQQPKDLCREAASHYRIVHPGAYDLGLTFDRRNGLVSPQSVSQRLRVLAAEKQRDGDDTVYRGDCERIGAAPGEPVGTASESKRASEVFKTNATKREGAQGAQPVVEVVNALGKLVCLRQRLPRSAGAAVGVHEREAKRGL